MSAYTQRVLAVGALLAVTAAVPAFAQNAAPAGTAQAPSLTIDELMNIDVQRVSGASRFNQEVVEAPASVSIITSEEIDRFGYRTLADVLRSVRGFYVSSDRNYSYVGARGFSRPGDYNTRILLLIDGHRMNDNVYDQAQVGTEFPLDVELIDRIEIVRGPSSSLYGTSAFFGVVNVITKRSADGGRAVGSVEAGSLGTRRGRATVGGVLPGGSDALLSVSGYGSDGQSRIFYPELQATTPTGGVAEHLDFDRAWRLFGRASRRGWTAQGLLSTRTKGIPTGAFETAINDERTRTRDIRGFLDLAYEGSVHGTALSFRTAYDQYDYYGTYPLQMAEGLDPDPLSDDGHGAWWTTELAVRRRVAQHLFTAGTEVRENTRQDQSSYYPESGLVTLADRRTSTVWGLYVQDEFRITRRALLNVGLRHDRMGNGTMSTNPRAALILRPRARASLKLLYGQAFRAPNAYELFYGADQRRELGSERIRSYEAVWEQYFAQRVRIATSVFLYRIRGLITQVPSDGVNGYTFANVDAAKAAGLSTEAELSLFRAVRAVGSYTYADAQEPTTHERLSNSPEHMGHVQVIGPIGSTSTFVGIDASLLGERRTIAGARAGRAAVWNVTLTNRRLVRHAELALDVRNLFDRAYGDPGSAEHVQQIIPQVGRTFGLRATWRF